MKTKIVSGLSSLGIVVLALMLVTAPAAAAAPTLTQEFSRTVFGGSYNTAIDVSDDGVVVAGQADGNLVAKEESGELWSKSLTYQVSQIKVQDGTAYVLTIDSAGDNSKLHTYNLTTGSQTGSINTVTGGFTGLAVSDSGDSIYIMEDGAPDETVAKYDSSLNLKWSDTETSSGVRQDNDLAIADNGDIFAVSNAGIVAYSPFGSVEASRTGYGQNDVMGVESYNGWIYIALEDNQLKRYDVEGHYGGLPQPTEETFSSNGADEVDISDDGVITWGDSSTVYYEELSSGDQKSVTPEASSYDTNVGISDNSENLAIGKSDIVENYAEPPAVQSVEATINGSSSAETYTGQADFQVNVTATYEDGSTEDVTNQSNWGYNSSIVSHSGNGQFQGVGGGTDAITATFTGPTGVTVSDSIDVTIKYPESVDFQLADSSPRTTESVSWTVTLNYEVAASEDITQDISKANLTYANENGLSNGLEIDYQNATVRASQSGNYTFTTYVTYGGVTVQSDDNFTFEPSLRFQDYNSLSPTEQIFVIFTDWGFLAMIASLLLSTIVGMKVSGGAGMATLTITLALSWIGGFVSIFVPATLIIFEVFVITVLDAQMVDSS
jgi:hypothetical protein